jgi:hypothetical protein
VSLGAASTGWSSLGVEVSLGRDSVASEVVGRDSGIFSSVGGGFCSSGSFMLLDTGSAGNVFNTFSALGLDSLVSLVGCEELATYSISNHRKRLRIQTGDINKLVRLTGPDLVICSAIVSYNLK